MSHRPLLLSLCLLCGVSAAGVQAAAAPALPAEVAHKIDADTWRKVAADETRDLIVLFDDGAMQAEARGSRARLGLKSNDARIVARAVTGYRALKDQTRLGMAPGEVEVRREYSHLPMTFMRVRDLASLQRLLQRKEVVAVYQDERLEMHLTQSLPLIGQSAVSGIVNDRGGGSVVAVLDTGVDYTKAAFGPCTAPGVPSATCRVIHAQDMAADDGSLDDNGHGSNVAAVVAGVAPDARIVALDVFSGGSASSSDVIAGINRAIALKTGAPFYNIVAINMSLGAATKYSAYCTNLVSNPYRTPIINARDAGILTIASSGNSAWTDGIAMPACTPEAVSVGAVYDANVGSMSWGGSANCTDSSTAADKVTCFSNSAGILSMLAPGALITAAGLTYGGTSQAAPHVAGAVAALQGAYPTESPTQILDRMLNHGQSVTDTRNGIAKPRLNLSAAFDVGPANDHFAQALALSGASGQFNGGNVSATKEVGEPSHAGNAGGRSVWFTWSAPGSGQVSLDTHGSGFNTLLAVYTGTTLGGLTAVAANDDDGTPGGASGLGFHAAAGSQYRIAVDGQAAASGALVLNWSFSADPPPSADLGIALADVPDPVAAGGVLTYTLTVTNQGPDAAVGVSADLVLPAGTAFVAAGTGCSQVAGNVTCALGDLAAGQQVSRDVQVSVAGAGAIASQASVGSATADGNAANDTASASTMVSDQGGTGAGDSGDVPLPPWAMLLLGVGLATAMLRRGARRV